LPKKCKERDHHLLVKFWFKEILFLILVLQDLKNQLNSRGAKTIRGLGRVFRNMDSFDGNKKLDRSEFFSGLCEVQCKVTQEDADVRFLEKTLFSIAVFRSY